MNFQPALISLTLCACLQAQPRELKPRGGGELKIGSMRYHFEIKSLSAAPAKAGLPGAVKLEGNLIPEDGSPAYQTTVTVLKNGSLYMLQILRKNTGSYPDTWAATLKTRTRALAMDDRPGGRIELRCEGRLTGVIAKRPQEAEWSGTLWAVFPGGGEDLSI